jgi:hypothetical protein
MCEPTTISMVVLGIAGAAQTAVSIQNSNNAAEAAANAANAAAGADFNALSEQRAELDQVAAGQSMDVQREMLRRRATLRVAQGESGIMGNTPVRELAALQVQRSTELSTIESNRASALAQSAREEGKIEATRRGRVSEAEAKFTSGWASGLQIGASGAQGAWQGYQIGSTIWPKTPKNPHPFGSDRPV